jgi:hypothetical protein
MHLQCINNNRIRDASVTQKVPQKSGLFWPPRILIRNIRLLVSSQSNGVWGV